MVQQNMDDCPWGDEDDDDAEGVVLDGFKLIMLLVLVSVEQVVLRPISLVGRVFASEPTRGVSPRLRKRRRSRASAFFEIE